MIAGEKKKKFFSLSSKKNFINCIVLSVNSRKITINNHDGKIIVKYFDKIDTNIYYLKEKYSITGTSLSDFCNIIKKLLNESEATLDDSKCISLIGRIKDFIDFPYNQIYIWLNYIYLMHMVSQPYTSGLQAKQNKTQVNRRRTDQTIAIQKANSELQEAIEKANAAAKAVINAERRAAEKANANKKGIAKELANAKAKANSNNSEIKKTNLTSNPATSTVEIPAVKVMENKNNNWTRSSFNASQINPVQNLNWGNSAKEAAEAKAAANKKGIAKELANAKAKAKAAANLADKAKELANARREANSNAAEYKKAAAANAAIIANQKGKNERQRYREILLKLNQWGPTSDQGSALPHRTNWSKQSTYTSYTLQQQNNN